MATVETELNRMLKSFHDVTVGAVGLLGAWLGAHLGFYMAGEESSDLWDMLSFLVGTALSALGTSLTMSGIVRRVRSRVS